MATVPYQPTYSLQPQHGTRYGPSQFAPPQAAATSPQTLGTQTPATTGVGAGQAAPQATGYSQDPFAQTAMVNGQAQSGVGFRAATPGTAYSYPGTGAPTSPAVPPTTAPPVTAPGAAVNTTIQTLTGGDNNQEGTNRIPQAQSLGYQAGTQNPMAGILGVMPVGSVLADALDINKDYTYGSYGTYDPEGNVFGTTGRAYDPVTGRPAQSYGSPSDWLGGWLGIGTPEGALGSSSSYGKLRAAGEDIPNSLLGSYDNSIYRQQAQQPGLSIVGARAARMRGEGAPFETIAGQIGINTQIARGDYTGLSDDDIDRMQGTSITAAQLGFGPNMAAPSNISGKFGTGTGDIVGLDGSMGLGVINENGTISSPTGTVVSLSDSINPGQTISLLDQSFANKAKIQQELDIRADTPTNACFPANTKIAMADGTTKPISDIVVGDKVIAFTKDNDLVDDEVTQVHMHAGSRSTDYMVKLILQNGKEITATSNHPIYMPEHNGFKWAGMFEHGELVMLKDGMMFAIDTVEVLGEITEPVYNFEVKDTHTYIAEDIRVHNGSGEDTGGSDEDIDQELQQDIAMAAHATTSPGADTGYNYSSSFDARDEDTNAAIGATRDVLGAASSAQAAGTDMQSAIDAKTSELSKDADVTRAVNNLSMVTDYASTYK